MESRKKHSHDIRHKLRMGINVEAGLREAMCTLCFVRLHLHQFPTRTYTTNPQAGGEGGGGKEHVDFRPCSFQDGV